MFQSMFGKESSDAEDIIRILVFGLYFFNPLRADRLLDRSCDELLDLERTDAGVAHADADRRRRELWHQIDREACE